MQSKLQFYHFQNEILEKFESELDRGDKKIHIVAPPGSGKTIMGIEMINRLIKKGVPGNVLILVPNITLQAQWKDKISDYFLEENEDIEKIVSLDRNIIKKINIITYQSITQSEVDTDDFLTLILENWYKDIKKEFNGYEDFLKYADYLKETNIKDYLENISKYKKKVKLSNSGDVLSDDVINYLNQLKAENISSIIVDEAHHLTNFRSKALYHIRKFLNNPFIVGLTATPPFENSDFFVLNDDYTALLGEVDYYVPTPAIVKAGRLAPYNDLVYFVEPGDSIKEMMKKNDDILNQFILENNGKISEYLIIYVKENYDKLLKNSQDLLLNYIKFLYNYGDKKIVSDFAFSDLVFENITLDDIAKSVGKYIGNIKGDKIENEDDIKNMFYNLGYIWRTNNFYRFRTPVEMALIYSKSKINGVKDILKKELENKGNNLKMAIITDFLDESENDYINAKFILEEINKSYPELKTILVSGQGIWQYENSDLKLLETDILDVTNKLENGEIKLVIGTRGILGEGWDCPKLNILIDLTGVSAYMSVNQIRGRAIRLDKTNPKKVANIYDVICLSNGYKGFIDYERVEKKYENFYGVDASGLVVKGINHIYPDLFHHLGDTKKINNNMLNRSSLLSYYYDLWGTGHNYENKEVFGLNLEIGEFNSFFPFVKTKIIEFFKFNNLFKNNKKEIFEEVGQNSFYFEIILRFLKQFIDSIVKTLIKFGDLPEGFSYEIKKSAEGNFKIISDYNDSLVSKSFINHINEIFSPISTQRYLLDIFSLKNNSNELKEDRLILALPNIVAKNEAYRDEIESNLSDGILEIVYGYIYKKYLDSFVIVKKWINNIDSYLMYDFIREITYKKNLSFGVIMLFLGISLFVGLLFMLNIYAWIIFIIGAIIYVSLYFLKAILYIYMNIGNIIKSVYWIIVSVSFLFLFALMDDKVAIYRTNILFPYLLNFCFFNIFILIFSIIYKKINQKLMFLFFRITNNKQINLNNTLTKTGVNSEYIKFIYMNSPLVKKEDYVGKKPFISGKIEKIWI